MRCPQDCPCGCHRLEAEIKSLKPEDQFGYWIAPSRTLNTRDASQRVRVDWVFLDDLANPNYTRDDESMGLPQKIFRTFRLERAFAGTPADRVAVRELGVVLWSYDGYSLFRALFGSDGATARAGSIEFPLLQRIRSEAADARYSPDELESLLKEIELSDRNLGENESARSALRLIWFACQEATRTGATLRVRPGATDQD